MTFRDDFTKHIDPEGESSKEPDSPAFILTMRPDPRHVVKMNILPVERTVNGYVDEMVAATRKAGRPVYMKRVDGGKGFVISESESDPDLSVAAAELIDSCRLKLRAILHGFLADFRLLSGGVKPADLKIALEEDPAEEGEDATGGVTGDAAGDATGDEVPSVSAPAVLEYDSTSDHEDYFSKSTPNEILVSIYDAIAHVIGRVVGNLRSYSKEKFLPGGPKIPYVKCVWQLMENTFNKLRAVLSDVFDIVNRDWITEEQGGVDGK